MAANVFNSFPKSTAARVAFTAVMVCAGCFLGAKAGTLVQFPGLGAAVLFPPYAVLAAALLLSPVRHWWIYVLAAAVGNFWPHLRNEGLTSFVLMAESANALRAIVAASTVRWMAGRSGILDTLRGTVAFLAGAVVFAPAIGATVGALAVVQHRPATDFWMTWQAWLLSNMLTGLTLLPLILILCTRARLMNSPVPPARVLEAIALALGISVVGAYLFTGSHGDRSVVPASLYAPLPLLLWAAVRFGCSGTILALCSLTALTIAGACTNRGPFITHTPAENLIQLQFFLIALCVPLLLLAAMVEEQSRTAAELRRSRADYRTVVEDQTELICRFLPDGTYTFVNGAYCRYFNSTPNQLLGRRFWEFVPPEGWEAGHAHLASITAARPVSTIEHQVIAPGGEIRWQQWTDRGFFDEQGRLVDYQAVGRDITGRKLAEEEHRQFEIQKEVARALRESEAQLRQLADAMPQIVWTAAPDGAVDYYNRKWYDLTGAVEGETGDRSWLPIVHPDDRRVCLDLWYRSVQTGEPFQMELRLKQRTGPLEYRWHLGRALPVHDESGKVVRWYGTCTDVHDRKVAEEALQDSESKLSEANRAKDRFLAALSHELRTPLTPVLLAAEAHRHNHALPDELCRDLNLIYINALVEAALIDDLLDLTRVENGKIELKSTPVDIHALLEYTARTCADETFMSKSLQISLQLDARMSWVIGDFTRLSQVFWNIIKNAAKFSDPSAVITIRTSDTDDNQLAIEFIDTGYGIEPTELDRIFNAFEQGGMDITRRFGGMGLGLALCKSFVEMHGGSISASSLGRGSGATLRVELPTMEAAEQVPISPVPPVTPRRDIDFNPLTTAGLGVRILLVEDHPFTADLLARLLRTSGHQVFSAENVATALEAAAQSPIDLVISDLGLPDGTGLELMSQLAREYGLRGIALSGYGMDSDRRESQAAGFVEHLVKPVSVEALQAAITRTLASTRIAEASS